MAKKRDHVTPLLKELHWLPVSFRTDFKVLVLTFKALSGSSPENIRNLLAQYTPSRNLRSSDQLLLARPPVPKKKFGDRAFMNCAVSLWNGLPLPVRKAETFGEFKVKLKIHYFVMHYGYN